MLPGLIFQSNPGRVLPASAASASAITTIAAVPSTAAATPASTARPSTAASATRSSASASAVTTAPATASARSSTAATTAAFTRGTRFVDDNVAAHEIVAVQTLHGAVGFFVAIDLDKSEPARLPRKTVAHQRDVCRGDSRLSK